MTPNDETIAALSDPGEVNEGTAEQVFETILAEKPRPRVLTESEREALRWFVENGPACSLDVTVASGSVRIFPTAHMRDRLLEDGLLERHAPRGMYLYEVSEAGRAALAAADPV